LLCATLRAEGGVKRDERGIFTIEEEYEVEDGGEVLEALGKKNVSVYLVESVLKVDL
jgi:hypothetical protein